MLSGVQVICFASSYAIALALELSRLMFRSTIRGILLLIFAGAGLLAHSAYLYYRAVQPGGIPLSSSQDWLLLAAWVLVVIYLYLLCARFKTPFGLVLLPLALALIGAAYWLADPHPYAREPASTIWGVIHSGSLLLATVAVLLGFAAGVTYLSQRWRLKHKRPSLGGLRLPSLEWLDRANSHATTLSVIMLGVGIVSGVILNSIRHSAQTDRLPWSDPVVLSTAVMFVWLLVAVVVAHLYKPIWRGRKVAYLTVASFVFLVIVLAMLLFLNARHGGANEQIQKLPASGASP
jgi:ABC-type uncharacterized transport system permease subunit